jgi:hypothetical protein
MNELCEKQARRLALLVGLGVPLDFNDPRYLRDLLEMAAEKIEFLSGRNDGR